MTDRTDRELLDAHLEGDAEAFGELFARHRDRLWAVAVRTMGNPDDAADALQDGLISAFRRAGTFRGEAQVTTWLHRIVVNACLDRIRSQKVRAADPLPDVLDDRSGRGSLATAAPTDPSDEAEVSETRRLVLAALAALPADQRAALVLVDMEGYPVAEVAAMLECPVGTVKSRCARGRARLAVQLGVLREPESGDPPHGNRPPPGSVPSTDPARAPPPRHPI